MSPLVPASPEQRRLWLVDRHEEGGAAYTVLLVWQVYGELDVPALEAALDALVARHEALRCAFVDDGDQVQMRVNEATAGNLRVSTASGAEQAEAELAAFLDRPLSLQRGEVFRAALWTLPEQEALLALVMHHAVVDGWSAANLAEDLSALYARPADTEGAGPDLPPVPGLAELAALQRRERTEQTQQEAVGHWREVLRGAPAELDLPVDRARRPDLLDWRGGIHTHELDRSTAQALRKLAADRRTTPFVVAISVLGVFLARWCNVDDLVIGVPVADDRDEVTERAVGFFVNTLPIRLDLSGDPSFDELIDRTQARAFEALLHREAPLDLIIRSLELDRTSGTHPLFQVMMTYQNVPELHLRLGSARVHNRPVFPSGAKFDLLVDLLPRGEGLNVRFEYRTALFDDRSIADAVGSYVEVLRRCLADPGVRVGEIDLPAGERMAERTAEQAIDSVRQPAATPPSVLALIADAVRAEPEAIAVSCGEARLTRRELWGAGLRLAARLRAAGVTPGVPVGSYLPRGVGLLVSLLGIWGAGGVYVPLDPRNPLPRNLFILDDAGIGVLVAERAVPELGRRTAVLLGEDGDTGPTVGEFPADPGSPAYVMYTSGSTGHPKGVLVGHGSLVGLIAEMERLVCPAAGDRMVASTTVTFDISLVELLLPLSAGVECVVADDATAADPVRLAELVRDRGVTVVQATPSVWRILAEHLGTGVRVAICGGEPLTVEVRDALLGLAGRAFNGYGPTEATVYSSAWEMTSGEISVGVPLRNNRFLVRDRWGRPAPAGTWGELWISGPALSHGYLNRPELTAEAFVTIAGIGRGYRTGDRARRTRDGRYQLRGRVDDQLKLRGYRIEPGEVESAINRLPGVSGCTVVAVDVDDNRSLAALVVPSERDGASAAVDDWRTQWEEVYTDLDRSEFSGWTSSLTGEYYPDAVMREWSGHTVDALSRLGFAHVLEIGAGSGIVTRPLARKATTWLATDISARSVDALNADRETLGPGFAALLRSADEWDGLPDRFDLIVLNSVIQYFPNRAYLDEVLGACLDRLSPGGRLFLGDLRSWPLARAHYRATAEARHPDADEPQLVAAADRLADAERELLVDPAYLYRLAGDRGDLRVSLRPKHLTAWSEMSAFRFDAVLTRDGAPTAPDRAPAEHVWRTPEAFEGICALVGDGRDPVVVRGIPNAQNAAWLPAPAQPATPATPAALVELARAHGCAAVVRVDPRDATLLCAYLDRSATAARRHAEWDAARSTVDPDRPLVGEPRRSPAAGFDPDDAIERLRRILPAYLVPHVIVMVPALPLLPSGKADRHRARQLVRDHVRAGQGPTAQPADPLEAAVRDAWARVLGHDSFDRADSFFRLGGDSLGAVRVLADLRRRLGVQLRLPQFVQAPTFAGLCGSVRALAAPPGAGDC
ncbi:amino acid adenylation domain-containing protein [Micromonospora sp. RTGN7]|uniref:non-ribosomal peptide synthetase n=1 Tax=Micromonospora sp. RTGN7 TaxID=3016526 RepID=UPI0029FF1940|nr:amino acid adenylation domain-containing protein [Micromonospora sp. RTGN7]